MNVMFVQQNCPLCTECEMAVTFYNAGASIGERIDIVDIFGGDSRLKLMEKLWGPDKSKWQVPLLVTDKSGVKRWFGNWVKGRKDKVLIRSVQCFEHYYILLKVLRGV